MNFFAHRLSWSLRPRRSIIAGFSLLLALAFLGGCAKAVNRSVVDGPVWWKGNLHAHSYRSDGDTFPELVADWYKRHGYHFLAITDHIGVGNFAKVAGGPLLKDRAWVSTASLAACAMRFGPDWVQYAEGSGGKQIVLKDLEDYRGALEQPGRFLLLSGEEISCSAEGAPVHLNAIHFEDLINAASGLKIGETLQAVLTSVEAQRREKGRPILAQINHPNFGWALTAEDIAPLDGADQFEIFNGILVTHNRGNHNGVRPGAERIWDIVLTKRLAELGKGPIFGGATDDAHNYHEFAPNRHNPGRGWVMVRAPELTGDAIAAAMAKGDFYASTGVELRDVRVSGGKIELQIRPERGARYKTEFIGTRKGYDAASEAVEQDGGKPIRTTRRYSDEIGETLAVSESLNPTYKFKGDEIYVRARVVSSELTENPIYGDDYKTAWTQPFTAK